LAFLIISELPLSPQITVELLGLVFWPRGRRARLRLHPYSRHFAFDPNLPLYLGEQISSVLITRYMCLNRIFDVFLQSIDKLRCKEYLPIF